MREFFDLIGDADIGRGAGDEKVTVPTGVCPECGGSGFILRRDGQAEVCRCYDRRRLAAAQRRARLQPALQRMTFEGFSLACYPANSKAPDGKGQTCYQLARTALDKTRQCCEAVADGCAPRGLLLMGQVGCGKTHLAAAAANYLLMRRRSVLFLVVPDFLEELRGAFSGVDEAEVRRLNERAKKVDFLVLDDLGSHNFSDWTRSVLFSILNYRMNEGLTTLATTNLDFPALQELLGDRSLSRLLSLCEPCLLACDHDIRLQGLEKA